MKMLFSALLARFFDVAVDDSLIQYIPPEPEPASFPIGITLIIGGVVLLVILAVVLIIVARRKGGK